MQAVPPKPSDIDDRFGRFDVKDLILGDETRSLVSDSWSTDVLGSDSELANETADRDRQSDRWFIQYLERIQGLVIYFIFLSKTTT